MDWGGSWDLIIWVATQKCNIKTLSAPWYQGQDGGRKTYLATERLEWAIISPLLSTISLWYLFSAQQSITILLSKEMEPRFIMASHVYQKPEALWFNTLSFCLSHFSINYLQYFIFIVINKQVEVMHLAQECGYLDLKPSTFQQWVKHQETTTRLSPLVHLDSQLNGF